MNWLDFFCLWVGYAICVLALVRAVVDGVFATYRAYRRMIRWVARRITPMTWEAIRADELKKPLP